MCASCRQLRRGRPGRSVGWCQPSAARIVCSLAVLAVLCLLRPATAHPLGNDSITHFDILYILPDRLEVDFFLDIAENPTALFESTEMDTDKDGQVSSEEQNVWLARKATEYAPYLRAALDGKPLTLGLVSAEPKTPNASPTMNKLIMPMLGPLGMTYRIVIRYSADYPQPFAHDSFHNLVYEDRTYPQHTGLKLVLLRPMMLPCPLQHDLLDSLTAGPITAAFRDYLEVQGVPLEADIPAIASPAAPTTAGRPRWLLTQGDQRYAMVEQPTSLDIQVAPYCEILDPHPPYLPADDTVFRYEQYDPMNLPDIRTGEVRFRVFSPPAAASSASDMPAAHAPTAASQPALGQLPDYAHSFLNPASNPGLTNQYQRQAEKLLGYLQGPWGLWTLLAVTVLSFGWGAAHALMPGHAKTVVAAYLISQRGTYWHAVVLAIVVTITHTALVVLLGLVIFFYRQSHPDLGPRLQIWLGITAGLLVAAMGLTLGWRAITGRLVHDHHDHDHDHAHDNRPWWKKLFTHSHPHVPGAQAHHHHHHHDHDHAHTHEHAHDHSHQHGHTHAATAPIEAVERPLTTRMLIVLGITGGIVPCPTATIIMLLGIGANVVLGALYAIGIFSLGLALTLMLIGSLALTSRRFARRLMSDAQHEGDLTSRGRTFLLRIIPALSGLVVVCLGSIIAIHYICLLRRIPSPFPWIG